MSIRQPFGGSGLLTVILGAVIIGCAFFVPAGAAAALNVQIIHPDVDPTEVAVGANVAFEAAAFVDGEELPAGQVEWAWQFGDATHAEVNPTSHAYIAAGNYTATVTATFNQLTATATTHVVVSDGPETPKAVPFDPALSVYVGFSGVWINYSTGQSEFREIEAPVALFEPGEQVSDEPDAWVAHLINTAPIPQGWGFFEPDYTEPMQMHVIIRDTQNRLGNVVVTNRDTAAQIGTIDANAAGAQIDGLLPLPSAVNYFLLTIRDKAAGATLAQAAADNPEVNKVVVCVHPYTWNPNRGDAPGEPPADHPELIGIEGPWGDPKSTEGKKPKDGSGGLGCAGIQSFENDNATTRLIGPKHDLKKAETIEPIVWTCPSSWSPAAGTAVASAVTAANTAYNSNDNACTQYVEPPYSRGDAHWLVSLNGHIQSIVAVPYRARHDSRAKLAAEAGLNWALGADSHAPSFTVAAGFTLTEELKDEGIAGPAYAIGDAWALVTGYGTPSAEHLQGITTQITIRLRGDKTLPADAAGPLGGFGTLTCVGAWTSPAPPGGPGGNAGDLSFPSVGDDAGVCRPTVRKGYTYKATATGLDHYTPGDTGNFNVPAVTDITMNVALTVQLRLKVITVRGGQPEAAHVQLKDADDQAIGEGDSTLRTGGQWDGKYVWDWDWLPPGTYYVRAGNGGAYGDWQAFQATPTTIPKEVTLTVPDPPPPPGD